MSEQLEKARGVALAHLNRRERTVAEVRAQLERKGIAADHADAVVDELVAERLVDDARFAEMFIADKRELEEWGTQRIRRGLAARGVERELVERALADADADAHAPGSAYAEVDDNADGREGVHAARRPPTELDRALALLRRRFPDPPRERRERDRALGVLLRKGYESDLALDALAVHAGG